MDGPAASSEPSVPEPAAGRRAGWLGSRYQPMWWALVFAAVTTAGLALLGWGLLVLHALSYGGAAVIGLATIAAPDVARYRLGFTAAVIVNLVSALGLAGLACHTPGRTWPPALQGFVAAVLAAVVASCALLLTVGINPVDFVVAL